MRYSELGQAIHSAIYYLCLLYLKVTKNCAPSLSPSLSPSHAPNRYTSHAPIRVPSRPPKLTLNGSLPWITFGLFVVSRIPLLMITSNQASSRSHSKTRKKGHRVLLKVKLGMINRSERGARSGPTWAGRMISSTNIINEYPQQSKKSHGWLSQGGNKQIWAGP